MHAGKWTICFALVFAAHVETANATSDELLITGPGGVPVFFDNFLTDPAAGGIEPGIAFTGGPAPVPLPVPLAVLLGTPGVGIVALTEPAGLPPEPGESPIVITGPTGQVFVSDLVVSTLDPHTGLPAFIGLVSDGDPQFQQITSLPPTAVFLTETGVLQDLTPLLVPPGNPFGPITVQAQSDVIPEPGTLLLFGSGLAGLAAVGARRRRV